MKNKLLIYWLTIVLTALLALTIATTAKAQTNPIQTIIGGQNAAGQFPYSAQLVLNTDWINGARKNFTWCGGDLIAPRFVLTAAHCVNGLSWPDTFISVRIGSSFADKQSLVLDGQLIKVKAVHVIPTYENYTSKDIAILELQHEADAEPIPLISKQKLDEISAYQGDVWVKGFGYIDREGTTRPSIIQAAFVPTIPLFNCDQQWDGVDINTTHFCAGQYNGNIVTARGDSGGSAIAVTNEGHKLIGPTSFGSRNSSTNGVFTLAIEFNEWIDSIVNH